MILPEVSNEKIINALNVFDMECLNTPYWIGWETKQNHKYAISYRSRLYPPKMIISLATGIKRGDFNGGNQTNKYLTARGFKIINLHTKGIPVDIIHDIIVRPSISGQGHGNDGFITISQELYRLLLKLSRYNYQTEGNLLPANGIYFFFEKGESVNGKHDRVVRVGTHREANRFRKRIRQHYGNKNSLKGNKNGSIFRKHVGGALLRRDDTQDNRLGEWLNGHGKSFPEVEEAVSKRLRGNFNFCCIEVVIKEERLKLEKGLIALLAQYPLGKPSKNWLGYHAADEKIKRSGLWNTQQLDAEPLNTDQLELLKKLACK